jgi:tetratricopeptide (TPR) repeat protein
MGTIAVALVVILGPISRPLRADLSYRDAQEDYIVGDIRASYDHMQSVVSLDSRNGQYRETLGKIFLEARDIPSALYEFEAGAQLRPGYALAERLAARINSDTGDIDRAVYWYEKALDSEPYGPFGLNQAAEFLATIGETDRMNERLAEYEKLNLEILNPVIADTYEALGDHDNAARVRGNRD